MKKFLLFVSTVLFLMFFANISFATTMYGDQTSWESAVGSFVSTTDYPGSTYDSLTAGTGFDVGYGTDLSFSIDLSVREIGSGWSTWSGGYTGEVLFTQGATSVTGTLSPGLTAFGFEAEPNPFGFFDITLTLFDGSTLTQLVEGDSGADFFGFTSDIAISSFTLTSARDFALGNFVAGSAAPIPEPATLFLFGIGILGLAGVSRKKLGK